MCQIGTIVDEGARKTKVSIFFVTHRGRSVHLIESPVLNFVPLVCDDWTFLTHYYQCSSQNTFTAYVLETRRYGPTTGHVFLATVYYISGMHLVIVPRLCLAPFLSARKGRQVCPACTCVNLKWRPEVELVFK